MMKVKQNIFLFFIAVLACGIGLLGFWLYREIVHPSTKFLIESGTTHIINLTKEGFVPAEITIHQGDVIVFTTTAGQDFWPASDPHPSHEIYPEFDPKRAINSDKNWSFKFDKIGIWNYHNHLLSVERGKVTVVGK